MIMHELHLRNIENKDWATLVFLIALVLIVLAKTTFESRFSDFVRMLVSNKYNKIYRESNQLLNGFNVLLFAVNLISLSFFIQMILVHGYHYGSKTDWMLFVRIFTLLGVFILSKFLIEKIIATTFEIEEFAEQINLQKVNYRTYVGLLLLPVTGVLYYCNYVSMFAIFAIIVILLTINVLTYLFSLKIYQNLSPDKLFYFILYLCALEIAPYYFIYYLITKN